MRAAVNLSRGEIKGRGWGGGGEAVAAHLAFADQVKSDHRVRPSAHAGKTMSVSPQLLALMSVTPTHSGGVTSWSIFMDFR